MTEIVGACLSQFHDDADRFELLLNHSDGREIGHVVSRTAGKMILAEFANAFDDNASPQTIVGWVKVPAEPPLELLKSINIGNQVLAYENGRYYSAWFEFEQSEGGWFWRDDADSEPNPSHYRPLMEAPTDV